MDEYDDWSLLEADPPHIDLRRRVWLSGRTYEVSACGGGCEPVAVRLTGRNAGGFIVTDLRGDVLPHDLLDVADLLQVTLEGVAAATRRDASWQPRVDPDFRGYQRPSCPPPEDLPAKAGARWTDEDVAPLNESVSTGWDHPQRIDDDLTLDADADAGGGGGGGGDPAGAAGGLAADGDPIAQAGRATAVEAGGGVVDRAGAAEGAGLIDDDQAEWAERQRFIAEADVDNAASGFGWRLCMESVA